MAHMKTKNISGKKSTGKERTEFCHNCKHAHRDHTSKSCKDCFGSTNTGKLYSYKNWEESKSYHKVKEIL